MLVYMVPNTSVFAIELIMCKQTQRHMVAHTSVYIIQAAENTFFCLEGVYLLPFHSWEILERNIKHL